MISEFLTRSASPQRESDGRPPWQSKYPMQVAYNSKGGACASKILGQCTGSTEATCPRAFFGSATEGGSPLNCSENNVGVSTFRSRGSCGWVSGLMVFGRVTGYDHFLLERELWEMLNRIYGS